MGKQPFDWPAESLRVINGVDFLPEKFSVITASDLDSILAIEHLSFQRPWGRSAFLDELKFPGSSNFAAWRLDVADCQKIVAYVFFRTVFDEMHILKIAVAPEWRCRGIGAALMNKGLALAESLGCHVAYLEVRPGNFTAVKLYRKLGFSMIAKRTGYYPETGEDALVMCRELRGES